MAVERSAWTGMLGDEAWTGAKDTIRLDGIVGPAPDGGSGAFLAITEAGRFFVKPLNNQQSRRVTLNEYVLGRMGKLIDAPVCDVAIIEIPDELVGSEFRPGAQLELGYAVGSREVPNVMPERALDHRSEDDNRRRHAGVLAFFDWCWGADDQWLYEAGNQNRLHSHDHGHFLPGGPDWTIETLEGHVDLEHPLVTDTAGLDVAAVEQHAGRMLTVTAEEIRGILSTVPRDWPVTQDELEALGWFLHRRAEPVGKRLQATSAALKGGQQL